MNVYIALAADLYRRDLSSDEGLLFWTRVSLLFWINDNGWYVGGDGRVVKTRSSITNNMLGSPMIETDSRFTRWAINPLAAF